MTVRQDTAGKVGALLDFAEQHDAAPWSFEIMAELLKALGNCQGLTVTLTELALLTAYLHTDHVSADGSVYWLYRAGRLVWRGYVYTEQLEVSEKLKQRQADLAAMHADCRDRLRRLCATKLSAAAQDLRAWDTQRAKYVAGLVEALSKDLSAQHTWLHRLEDYHTALCSCEAVEAEIAKLEQDLAAVPA